MQLSNFRLTGNGDKVTETVHIAVTPSLTHYLPCEIYPTLQVIVRAKVTANVTMENFFSSYLLLQLFGLVLGLCMHWVPANQVPRTCVLPESVCDCNCSATYS